MPKLDYYDAPLEEPLVLPLKGSDGEVRDYTIQPASAEWWLRFAALKQVIEDQKAKRTSASDDEQRASEVSELGHREMRETVLGAGVVEQMLTDGVSAQDLRRAVGVAFLWQASGCDDDVARAAWSGKAPDPSTSASTESESKTPTPGSTTSTTSRRKPSQT